MQCAMPADRSIVERLFLPTPFPVGPVNAYLVHGDPPALIDVGVKGKKACAALEHELQSRGLVPSDLGAILITHAHFDHSGAAVALAEEGGTPVYCHYLAGRDRTQAEQQAFYELIERCGAPERLLRGLNSMYRFGSAFGDPLGQAGDLRVIDDGDRVRAGDLELEVLHTPGHAPDHLCFLAREQGLLFCGDLLLESITPNPLPHFDPEHDRGRVPSLPLYLESLDRVEALGPLQGLTGHGGELPDTAATARSNRTHIEGRTEIVLRACRARPGATVFELSEVLFDSPDRGTVFLALSETIAHLDRLEVLGLVRVGAESGRVEVS